MYFNKVNINLTKTIEIMKNKFCYTDEFHKRFGWSLKKYAVTRETSDNQLSMLLDLRAFLSTNNIKTNTPMEEFMKKNALFTSSRPGLIRVLKAFGVIRTAEPKRYLFEPLRIRRSTSNFLFMYNIMLQKVLNGDMTDWLGKDKEEVKTLLSEFEFEISGVPAIQTKVSKAKDTKNIIDDFKRKLGFVDEEKVSAKLSSLPIADLQIYLVLLEDVRVYPNFSFDEDVRRKMSALVLEEIKSRVENLSFGE